MVERYRSAPRPERVYVAWKLRFDPVLRLLAEQAPLGRVADLGCGRGQLALAALDLGVADSVLGVDLDARKVSLAVAASPAQARFVVGDALTVALGEVDSVLLVDLLHYLPAQEHDALLCRATNALAPGGRLFVRELSASSRAAFARGAEVLAVTFGINRGRTSGPQRVEALGAKLRRLGLEVRRFDAGVGPLANELYVAERPRVGSSLAE